MFMKTVLALLLTFGWGIFTISNGQTGLINQSPAASVSAPPQPPAPHKKQRMGWQKKQHEIPPKPVAQDAAPGPGQTHRDGRIRSNTNRPPAVNYTDALKRQHRDRHNQGWWRRNYTTIVFVNNCGYYYWDAGYWFPAFGYDPRYEAYEYNGPIYTYGNLLPDQVIYNVQRALKELGYYTGPLTGSMSSATINSIGVFQEDNGLDVTGAIDAPTVEALGLY